MFKNINTLSYLIIICDFIWYLIFNYFYLNFICNLVINISISISSDISRLHFGNLRCVNWENMALFQIGRVLLPKPNKKRQQQLQYKGWKFKAKKMKWGKIFWVCYYYENILYIYGYNVTLEIWRLIAGILIFGVFFLVLFFCYFNFGLFCNLGKQTCFNNLSRTDNRETLIFILKKKCFWEYRVLTFSSIKVISVR